MVFVKNNLLFVVCFVAYIMVGCKSSDVVKETTLKKWVDLLGPENSKNWLVKIKGHPLQDNFNNTFQIKEGSIAVNYDKYSAFDNRYGHLFYAKEFSSYILKLDYRFVGKQVDGGAEWAYENSGIMVHCESPYQMGIDQNFPVSVEVQLLGSSAGEERTTANVCTPGTHITLDGNLEKKHCISSRSETYEGDQWVSLEIEVYGDSLIRHSINGQKVMEYTQVQIGGKVDANMDLWKNKAGNSLKKGYVSLQSESHPIEFKNIKIKEL